jgi:tripartite-type tricarboxylate transporter receptor subunit TctC
MLRRLARLIPILPLIFPFLAGINPASAQTYPNKPVRIISAFAAGGTNDVIARTIAPKLSEHFGQQFIVENRPGGGGVIGTEFAAKSPADGYTLTIATTTTHVIAAAMRKLPYDPVKDFSPINLIGATPYMIVVHPSMPVKNVKDLIAVAKSRPNQVEFGSGGVGTPGHLAGAMLNTMTGIKMLHVPYKAGNLALNELIGGHVSLTFSTTITSTQFIQSGRLRGIAVTSINRLPAFPNLPTVAESGVPGYEFSLWLGLSAPAKTPEPVIQILADAVAKALQNESVRSTLIAQSVEPVSIPRQTIAKRIESELIAYEKIVKQSGAMTN